MSLKNWGILKRKKGPYLVICLFNEKKDISIQIAVDVYDIQRDFLKYQREYFHSNYGNSQCFNFVKARSFKESPPIPQTNSDKISVFLNSEAILL